MKPGCTRLIERAKLLRVGYPQIAKAPAHFAVKPAREGAAASHLVFIDAALAFMHPHRTPMPDGAQRIFRVDGQFIAGMSDLMDGRIQAVERVRSDNAGGYAAVLPCARGSGCTAKVNGPLLKS